MGAESLFVDTIMQYLNKLTTVVENKVTDRLPRKFALICDGCSAGDPHYLYKYATFPSSKMLVARNCCFFFLRWAMNPTLMPPNTFILSSIFYLCLTDLWPILQQLFVTIAAGTRNYHQWLRSHLSVSLRFNLAVRNIIEEDPESEDAVRKLMQKLF